MEVKGREGQDRDGIWIIDAKANTVFANARMAEILGTTVADLIGKPSFEYVFPKDRERAQKLFERKEGGDSQPFYFHIRRKDGTPLAVDVQGTPMHSTDGEFIGIVGTFRVVESILARIR
jgi:PAS domain S-box-containing protein